MDRPAHPASRFDRWTLLTLVGGGAFLFWAAGHYTVFDDEAHSCRLYAMPMGDMLRALWQGADPDPPLFYILQNAWVRLFGVGPLALRTLPILFFLGGLVAMRAAGRAWFGPATGLAAMLICALHPAHLFFGFAARWYSLMFLTVGLLLWATAALTKVAPQRADPNHRASRFMPIALWSVAAAAVCYTNYFGIVVVALVWIAGLLAARGSAGDPAWKSAFGHNAAAPQRFLAYLGRRGCRPLHTRRTASAYKRMVLALLLALALSAAWAPPLFEQMAAFDRPPATLRALAATAARTGAALLSGNLAAPTAWWVWAPTAFLALAFAVLLLREWNRVRPIALVVLGCFAAGVGSRTMIDKYVMTFSGPACLLVAALLCADAPNQRDRVSRVLRRVAAISLVAGWLGCGVNLVRERHWSSLRWLDPFEQVTAELLQVSGQQSAVSNQRSAVSGQRDRLIVASHPSARYYFALHVVRPGEPDASTTGPKGHEGHASLWLSAFQAQASDESASPVATPAAAISRIRRALDHADPALRPPQMEVTTLETSGYVDLPDWQALRDLLQARGSLVQEAEYGEDPHADWKDWLDPAVRHPTHRIIVTRWELPNPPPRP